jgi:hypothetical protein
MMWPLIRSARKDVTSWQPLAYSYLRIIRQIAVGFRVYRVFAGRQVGEHSVARGVGLRAVAESFPLSSNGAPGPLGKPG